MANLVEIVIKVDNAEAVSAIGATTTALKQAGVAGTVSFGQLESSSGSAAAGLGNVGNAARTMSGHMASSLDGVRLLSQEFGLRLPRALESMISRLPAVTSAIQGMMGAFAGIAIAEVVYRAGEAVYNLYNKYISLNAVADDYYKTVQKHNEDKFVDTHSIEATKARIDEATKSAHEFISARRRTPEERVEGHVHQSPANGTGALQAFCCT